MDDDFLKQVEKAAEKGASKGGIKHHILSIVIISAVAIAAMWWFSTKVEDSFNNLKDQFKVGSQAEEHDLVLEDSGFLGYTAADFSEAILGNAERVKKLEVYEQEISDLATLTDTGLFNLNIFKKVQYLTYHGTAVYTVDLSNLKESDITVNDDEKTVYLYIPHAKQEKINIPEDEIEFGDTSKGILAFGDIEMTAEQAASIQSEVRTKMKAKLADCNAAETADRFAVLSVWEMYNPLVKSIAPGYTLKVEFK